MKIETALKKLRKIKKELEDDPERAHSEADDILLRLIDNEDITEAFEDIDRWYA